MGKEEPLFNSGRGIMGTASMEASMEISQKLKSAGKFAQWVKHLPHKPGDPSLTKGTNVKVEREN